MLAEVLKKKYGVAPHQVIIRDDGFGGMSASVSAAAGSKSAKKNKFFDLPPFHFFRMDSACVPCPLEQVFTLANMHLVAPLLNSGVTNTLSFSISEMDTQITVPCPASLPRTLSVVNTNSSQVTWHRYQIYLDVPQSATDFESSVHEAAMEMGAISWWFSAQWLIDTVAYHGAVLTFHIPSVMLPPGLWPNLVHQCSTYLERVAVVNRYILRVSPHSVGFAWETEEQRIAGRRKATRTHTTTMDSRWWETMDASGLSDGRDTILVADVDDTRVYIHECRREDENMTSQLWPAPFQRMIAQFIANRHPTQ